MKIVAKGLAPLLLVSAWAVPAADLGPLVTDQPVTWREGVIQLGDTGTQVRKVTGRPPDREVPLYLGERYPVGRQWMFIGRDDNPQLLWVELIHGRVSRVWTETKDGAARAP